MADIETLRKSRCTGIAETILEYVLGFLKMLCPFEGEFEAIGTMGSLLRERIAI